MKSVGKCSLLVAVAALAPRVARADSVAQFAPIDEAASASPPRPSPAPPPPATPVPVNRLGETSPPGGGSEAASQGAAAASAGATTTPVSPTSSTLDAASLADLPSVGDTSGRAAEAAVPTRALTLTPEPRGAVSDTATASNGEPDDAHYVSLTFSVARAVASLYEVTGEVALGRNFGLALLGGVGSLEAKHPEYDQTVELKGTELGAQARVYLVGGFDHGLMLGGEALRIWADVSPTQVTDPSVVTINGTRYGGTATLSGEGTLTGLAAFIGYKVVASFGLTLDAKLGWQSLTLTGTGRLDGEAPINGQTVPVSESGTIRETRGVPLFNLNLGWSI